MISTASHEDGNGSRKENAHGRFSRSVSASCPKKKFNQGYGTYNAKHRFVYQRSLERNGTPDYATGRCKKEESRGRYHEPSGRNIQ
jgi:hypothetical protein